MRPFFLLLIRLYWLLPKRWRRSCIFKDSCSVHVYRKLSERGFKAGWDALKRRYRQCRPGYAFYTSDDGKDCVILSNGELFGRDYTTL